MNRMFSKHLKAEDFVNVMEGSELRSLHQAHLDSCAKCSETLRSIQFLRDQMADGPVADDVPIAEPNWDEFRSGVRSALLSRSVQRERARQSWFGEISWKPALAWGMSLALVIVITSGVIRWSSGENGGTPEFVMNAEQIVDPLDPEVAATIARTDVLDEVLQLSTAESESLQRLLLEDLAVRE